MLVLLKFVFIFFLVLYLISKIFGFFIRTFFGRVANQQRQHQQTNARQGHKKPAGGNVNIDYVPGDTKPASEEKDFRGGDYVEYEEVK